MWNCPNCREESEDDFQTCWNCGADRSAAPSAATPASTAVPAAPGPAPKLRGATGGKSDLYAARYRDAYQAARLVIALSGAVKFLGFAVALLIVGSGALLASQSDRGIFAPSDAQRGVVIVVALLQGFAAALLGHVLGTVVAAFGHMLRTSVDTAVHTSPLLTPAEAERLVAGAGR